MKNLYILFLLAGLSAISGQEKLNQFIDEKKHELNEARDIYQLKISNGEIFDEEVWKGIVGYHSNGLPIYVTTLNKDAGESVNVDEIWNLNFNGNNYILDGTGMIIYMWDENQVRASHVELTGRTVNLDPGNLSYHATAVAGTIGAAGVNAAAKGMAPNIGIKTRNYTDYSTEIPAQLDAKVSNHSYGNLIGWVERTSAPAGTVDTGHGWYFYSDYSLSQTQANLFGNYTSISQFWDETAYLAPEHIMLKSAGNSAGNGPHGSSLPAFVYNGTDFVEITSDIPENNCGNGYDCLLMGSAAKNIIIVGASNQLTTADRRYQNPSDVSIGSFSSIGPRDDGGIKPDVVAVGNSIFSPVSNSNTAYQGGLWGTSFSCPSAAGVVAIWDQLYQMENGTYMRSDLAKALITHTANECGLNPGPDYKFGWGLINALEGVTTILDTSTSYVGNETLNNGIVFEKTITASGIEPLKVSISWLDPAAQPIPNSINDRTSRLVNDLDLRIIKVSDNSESFPWKLDPNNPANAATQEDNTVDNVEQVYIETPESHAEYKIVVSNKNNLVDDTGSLVNSVPFGLVISGIGATAGTDDVDYGDNDFSIYPNPASETLRFNLKDKNEIKSVSIFNTEGKLVLYENAVSDAQLDISKLTPSTYMVVVNTLNARKSFKFIKK